MLEKDNNSYTYGFRFWSYNDKQLYSPFSFSQIPWQRDNVAPEKLSAFDSIDRLLSHVVPIAFRNLSRSHKLCFSDKIVLGIVRTKDTVEQTSFGWQSSSMEIVRLIKTNEVLVRSHEKPKDKVRWNCKDETLQQEIYLNNLAFPENSKFLSPYEYQILWKKEEGSNIEKGSILTDNPFLPSAQIDKLTYSLNLKVTKEIEEYIEAGETELQKSPEVLKNISDDFKEKDKILIAKVRSKEKRTLKILDVPKQLKDKLKPLPLKSPAPVKTAALGFRSWDIGDIQPQCKLYPPARGGSGRDSEAFEPGINTAYCSFCNDIPVTYDTLLMPDGVHSCGFHAFHNFDEAFNSRYKNDNSILGSIAGFGKVQIHDIGWRSEKAGLIALYAPLKVNLESTDYVYKVQSLSRYYQVPVFSNKKLLNDYAQSKADPIKKLKPSDLYSKEEIQDLNQKRNLGLGIAASHIFLYACAILIFYLGHVPFVS